MEKIKSLPSIFEDTRKAVLDDVSPTKQVLADNRSLLESVPSLQTPETIDPEVSISEIGSILNNGFDLKENHYSKNKETDGTIELPYQRISNEESLMDDSESIGEISEVEVTRYDCNDILSYHSRIYNFLKI